VVLDRTTPSAVTRLSWPLRRPRISMLDNCGQQAFYAGIFYWPAGSAVVIASFLRSRLPLWPGARRNEGLHDLPGAQCVEGSQCIR
jgi:hypothetical protein